LGLRTVELSENPSNIQWRDFFCSTRNYIPINCIERVILQFAPIFYTIAKGSVQAGFSLERVRRMQLITNSKTTIFIILIILIILVLVLNNLSNIKIFSYRFLRNISKVQMEISTNNFNQINAGKFLIRYSGVKKESAHLVAETGNEIFEPVNELLGCIPKEKIPVIVYPSMKALNESFGWEGDKSPMGVYWMGTIRVLAPEAWIDEEDIKDQSLVFKTMGPMAHEYAHLVVDYKTNGNYTRWFTEGIAQYVEKKLTGFTLDEPTEEAKLNIYSFNKLDRNFDEQPDQDLAYWQSLLAVEYLVEKHGEHIINELLEELAQGNNLNAVFKKVVGEDLAQFEKNIRKYCRHSL